MTELNEKATIDEVAAAAGVSRATVSRVMNNRSTVNAEMAERVRRVASELQYRPSDVARSLSLGRTQVVAIVVPDLGNPMFLGVVRGIVQAAALEGYRVALSETEEDVSAEADIAREARSRCDAVVIVSPGSPQTAIDGLVKELAPAVAIGSRGDDAEPTGLGVDFGAGIEILVDHLAELGHRDFLYLGGPTSSPGNLARLAGLERVKAAHPQFRFDHQMCGSRMDNGYRAIERVLASRATAVIAYNDLVAFGLLARLNETGVAVPQDISVVGLDNIALAAFAVPPLTTLAVPEVELGRLAWEQLRARIERKTPPASELSPPALVIRSSTGPVPQRRSRRRRVESPEIKSLDWHRDGSAEVLLGNSLPLLRYERGDQLPTIHSPRPFAHPIRTLAGTPLTTAGPRDHRHHFGLSLALPDVNGTTYWGGRTYLADLGPTLLANHGRQRVLDRAIERVGSDHARLAERLAWEDEFGDNWLHEERSLTGVLLPEVSGWMLKWRSVLIADETDIEFSSPAVNGRQGAGYGGIFWRFDANVLYRVFGEHGAGDSAVHGRQTAWVAVAQGGAQGSSSVILRQPEGRVTDLLPWFCRASSSEYTGIGPAIAWDHKRKLPFGASLELGLDAIILDRLVDPEEAAAVVASINS